MRIWQTLESLVGPAAVLAEWQKEVGDELPFLMPYLQPRAKFATSYPRLDGGKAWQAFRVVEHGPNDIVGICDDTQERISLTRQELVIYEIQWSRLLRDIALALGFDHAGGGDEKGPSGLYLVGYFRPLAGFSFPTYLFVPTRSIDTTNAIRALGTIEDAPFILLLPTNTTLQPEGRRVIEWKKSCSLSLSESMFAMKPGQWISTESVQRALQTFAEIHVPGPAPPDGKSIFVPTPANATWGDLIIRFVDGHTVAIRVGTEYGTYHYAQLGMADGRNAKPTKQWELLGAFARNNGVLTWKSSDANRKNKKRRELLARDLKAIFRIEGEPIVTTDDGKGWQTAFVLAPDG